MFVKRVCLFEQKAIPEEELCDEMSFNASGDEDKNLKVVPTYRCGVDAFLSDN